MACALRRYRVTDSGKSKAEISQQEPRKSENYSCSFSLCTIK
ncbi:MAG: hypothetical protein P8X74_05580 [Reinekea sp.]